MDEVKTFEELKEEFGNDYDKKLYEMGVSALNEITRLNNIIEELEKWINDYIPLLEAGDVIEETTQDTLKEVLDKLNELKENNNEYSNNNETE